MQAAVDCQFALCQLFRLGACQGGDPKKSDVIKRVATQLSSTREVGGWRDQMIDCIQDFVRDALERMLSNLGIDLLPKALDDVLPVPAASPLRSTEGVEEHGDTDMGGSPSKNGVDGNNNKDNNSSPSGRNNAAANVNNSNSQALHTTDPHASGRFVPRAPAPQQAPNST